MVRAGPGARAPGARDDGGARPDDDARQQDGGLRLRVVYGRRLHVGHEAGAMYGVHPHPTGVLHTQVAADLRDVGLGPGCVVLLKACFP